MNVVPLRREFIAPPPEESLVEKAARLAFNMRGAEADEILRYAIGDVFKGRIALVSSFGAESVTLLNLVARVDRTTPVIFLETGKHFQQTLNYRKTLAKDLGLTNVIDVKPAAEDLEREDSKGDLWRNNPDACCDIRKVRPLKHALDGFDAWITGRKQFHGGARLALPVFEASGPHVKVNPIVRWTQDDVSTYVAKHKLPAHPLVEEGFPSIGCWPCTRPADANEDVRAGRWRGSDKTECGIHKL